MAKNDSYTLELMRKIRAYQDSVIDEENANNRLSDAAQEHVVADLAQQKARERRITQQKLLLSFIETEGD